MSQYVHVECNVLEDVKVNILNKALSNMKGGLSMKPVNKAKPNRLRGKVDTVLCDHGNETSIGFQFVPNKNNKLKLVVAGEFYGSGFNKNDFIDDLCKNYQLAHVNQMIKDNNWNMVSRKVEEDNTVVLRVAV